MRKMLALCAALACVLTLCGCRSSKKGAKKDASAEDAVRRQRTDAYTGWVYIPEKRFSVTNSDVRVELDGPSGSFCLYAIPEKGEPVPLLSTYDTFSSSFFVLRVGRQEYQLNRENGVQAEARRTPYGAQMAYTIKGKAQIVVDFSFLPSIATSSRVDMLRVTVYAINIGKKTEAFTVKGIFDTVLGENTPSHFSTAATSRINTERQFVSMEDELWVRSANESAAIQFLLEGKGITRPEFVTLSNKDLLAMPRWVPAVQQARSFNSVLSYNNSAVGINWPQTYLDPMKTHIITFYISVAIDGGQPAGRNFLAALAEGRTALSARTDEFVATTSVAPSPEEIDGPSTPYWANMPVIASEPGQQAGVAPPPARQSDDALTDARLSPRARAVTDRQLEPSYIQALLDHIASLGEDGSAIDEAELNRLNEELDAIMEKLRSLR